MAKYYVDTIWPHRKINLVAGSSGAGKTRWIVPQLFALLEGRPILGHVSKRMERIAYVACDRTSEDAKDTMSDMGFDPAKLFVFSFMDNEIEWSLAKVIDVIPPKTELTYVEAIGALVQHGKINDYHEVLRFGRSINKAIRTTGSEFTGSTHVPKLKQDENFKHTRENVFGAASWAGVAGTIVVIEELPTTQRAVNILTRDYPAERLVYEFNEQGHLAESGQLVGKALMDRWLEKMPPNMEFQTSVAVEAGEKFKLSRPTVARWLAECVDEGRLQVISRGIYRKRHQA